MVGWDSKTPSKNSAVPRKECLCEPGSSPKELPRRNRYFSPSRYRLGLGTKCAVWSCLLLLVRHRRRPTRIVSALVFRKKYYAASRLLWSATVGVRRIWVDFTCFLSSIDFRQKVCLWAVPLFTGNEKKRKLKQPLNILYFGLPLSRGTSRSWRLLLRHLKGLFTELMGFSRPFTDRIFFPVSKTFSNTFSAAQDNFTFFNCFPEMINSSNWNLSACSSGRTDKRTFSAELFQKPLLQHF